MDCPKNRHTKFYAYERKILEELIVAMKPVLQKHISKTAGV